MKNIFIIFLVSITSLTYAQNSILFDASDQQYLTISNADDRFNATADFTYEVWVKFTSKRFNGQRLAPFFGGQQHDYAALLDDRIGMRLNSNGVCSGDRTFGNASTIDTDIWYHIAYVRSGSVVSLYLDGTLLGTTECAQEDGSVKGVWMINANTINIGAIFWNTSYLDGYIGGMRYVVGTALYSEDFTPQLRWEKTSETILLMNIKNEDAAFTDESDYSNTITLNGSSSTPTFVAGNGPTLPADILLSGDVSIENNSIKNVADPVYAQDAATKNYVDSNVNSFSGSYNDLTDTPTMYTQAQVDVLISSLQDQIDALQSASGSGTVTDQDGNSYPYLTYGDQVWTVKNAEVVTYRDGTAIPQVTDNTEWENLTTGAWCYYDNDPNKGKLYNWYAVMGIHDTDPNTPNKEFAPEGWHVPTDAEWTTLENHLIVNGYNYDQTTTGNKIAKAMASTTGWNSSTSAGAIGNDQSLNNSTGFNAFPEGYRLSNSSFNDEGNFAIFWSSTENNTNNAWGRGLNSNNSDLNRDYDYKQNGFSLRFVRD